MRRYNQRLGLIFFAVYTLLYIGFVALNAISAETMEMTPVAGINLAVLYGFGLMIAAIVMAMVYGAMCKATSGKTSSPEADGEGQQ
ncbi:MAG: DUF485 domain-containing protein [Pirellulaceae bacterium]